MKRKAIVVALAIALCWASSAGAASEPTEAKAPSPAKIVTKEGALYIVELTQEDGEIVRGRDLKTGKEVAIPQTDVTKLTRDISDEEAIKWAGMGEYLAWRLKRAGAVTPIGQVATVTPTAVYVNLGAQDGIEKGDALKVYRLGEALTDPETGESLGRLQSLVAELQVTEVEEKFCKARQTSQIETVLARGDSVQPVVKKRAVAVLPIATANPELADVARLKSEEWTTKLVASDVPVVARKELDPVILEIGLQLTGLVDPDTAMRLGKLVGAYAVLTGSLTEKGPGQAVLHARLIRVQTGEVLVAAAEDLTVTKPTPAPVVRPEQGGGAPAPAPLPAPSPAGVQSDSVQQALARRVTLTKPYPASYAGAETDRISVQYAVMEVLKQVGLRYNWQESYNNTNPACREWVTPNIVNRPANEALDSILGPKRLTYELRGDEVVLKRR